MTSDDFRSLALALPGATEGAHMGHPDFRINGKVFATLYYPNTEWGMVKLSPEQQHDYMRMQPNIFMPATGAWGRQGCTNVRLETADPHTLDEALRFAYSAAAHRPRAKSRRKRA